MQAIINWLVSDEAWKMMGWSSKRHLYIYKFTIMADASLYRQRLANLEKYHKVHAEPQGTLFRACFAYEKQLVISSNNL